MLECPTSQNNVRPKAILKVGMGAHFLTGSRALILSAANYL